MNYTNILIPVDGSEDAKFACKVAADLAKSLLGQEVLHLLHCVETIPGLIGGQERKTLMRDHEERAGCIFSVCKKLLEASDNVCKTYLRYGDAADTRANTL